MSKFLKSSTAFWMTLLIGIICYLFLTKLEFKTYNGVCLRIEKPWRSIYNSAAVGIDDGGILKTVEVYLDESNNVKPGDKLTVKRRIIDFSFGRQLSNGELFNDYVLLIGRINKFEFGAEFPLDQRCTVAVTSGGDVDEYMFEGIYYFIYVRKGIEHELTFSAHGFKKKRLKVFKNLDLDDSIFSADCIFRSGEGLETSSINLDSCAINFRDAPQN